MSRAVWHALQCCSFLYFNSQYWLRFFFHLKPFCSGRPKFFSSKKGYVFLVLHKVGCVLSLAWYLLKACPHKKHAIQKSSHPVQPFAPQHQQNLPALNTRMCGAALFPKLVWVPVVCQQHGCSMRAAEGQILNAFVFVKSIDSESLWHKRRIFCTRASVMLFKFMCFSVILEQILKHIPHIFTVYYKKGIVILLFTDCFSAFDPQTLKWSIDDIFVQFQRNSQRS